MDPEQETSYRKENIATNFLSRLEEKGLVIQTPEFQKVGEPAYATTNESGNPALFEKVKNLPNAPNGYLIGIGAANVFSMLESFPEGVTPKAIILFDIDPTVIAYGQRLIQAFKDTPADPSIKLDSGDTIFHTRYKVSHENAIKKYGPMLHQLAKEGNLIIARTDFTRPELMDEIAKLPDFQNSNNIIYLSNIADHIYRRNPNSTPDFSFLQKLKLIDSNRNFYIDTLQNSLNYQLRISIKPPNLLPRNFTDDTRLNRLQTELTDKTADDEKNILWEDIEDWPLDKLINYYNKLINSPAGQERKKDLALRINHERSYTLEQYPEYKIKSTRPLDETRGIKKIFSVPSDPKEESLLLDELAQPYNYERYLIPFVARNYWQDAKTPEEINPNNFPIRDYYVEGPKNWTRGKVEILFLEQGITYEELAMAKLYQELESRVLARMSGARTQGKTFSELTKEALPPY